MNLHDLTTLGRSIDFHVSSNRVIVAMTTTVTVGGTVSQIVSQVPWQGSALWGAQAGLTVFIAWALCRELDPDHSPAALVAAAFAILALFVWGLPRLVIAFWMVAMARVVNRTTGQTAGILDALGLLGLTAWLSREGNWLPGFVTALAFYLDSRLPARRRLHLLFAGLALIVTLMVGVGGGGVAARGRLSITGGLVALALSSGLVPITVAARSVDSVGDQSGQRLTPVRVQAAQALMVLYGIGSAFLKGPTGITALIPLWAGVVGAGVTWVVNALLP